MYAIGHTALGYLIGKSAGKTLDQAPHIPIIWALSLMPDIDLLIPWLRHRGPTHSIIIITVVFTPFLLLRARRVLPYFLALITHPFLGDYFTGEVQILWPVSTEWLHYKDVFLVGSVFETYVEWGLFILMALTFFASRDYRHVINSDKRNIVLLIPLFTIVFPVMYNFPMVVPDSMLIPHIFLFGIMMLSITMPIYHILNQRYRLTRGLETTPL